MLDISLPELAGRAADEVLAQQARLGVNQRHRILQLIAEAECAARLVVSAARPHAARQGLIHEPAVDEHVQGRVRRFHLHCAESVSPVLPYLCERSACSGRSPKALHQSCGVIGAAPSSHAQPEDDLALLTIGQLERNLDGGAGVQSRPHLVGEMQAGHGGRMRRRAVAPEELGAVAADGPGRIVHVKESNPVGELDVVGVACEERTALRVDLGDDMHRGFRPQVSEDPLHVSGGR